MEKSEKLLLVDDSAFMRNVLKHILQEEGFKNFVEASNGQEALDQFAKEKPDLVLLDIIMPEMDGIKVLKKIGQEGKIIVVSAVGQESMVEQAKKLGAKGYVIKPFENAKVIEEVNKVLG
jgi:two-component system chemotaxis response regulator CheY